MAGLPGGRAWDPRTNPDRSPPVHPVGPQRRTTHDLIIVGGGIGGIISLKYAKDAGLDAILLEKGDAVSGLWRDLRAWQDLQIRKEDWTLGDLPIAGEDQASVLANIREWVERFELAPSQSGCCSAD